VEVDRARWDRSHAAGASPTLARIRRATLTSALPNGVEPTTVWPAWPLDRVVDELEIAAGETLVDLGCGRGEIGLWLAAAAGTRLVGVDPSSVGLQLARELAQSVGADAVFVEGVVQSTGLDDGAADAVVITDVLPFLEDDRANAFAEVARLLKPGRRLVVVGPERTDPTDALRTAGLEVEVRAETPGWRDAVTAFGRALADEADQLRDELGDVADELIARVQSAPRGAAWHGLTAARRTGSPG
jgi:SAM-dependent methyltransferase